MMREELYDSVASRWRHRFAFMSRVMPTLVRMAEGNVSHKFSFLWRGGRLKTSSWFSGANGGQMAIEFVHAAKERAVKASWGCAAGEFEAVSTCDNDKGCEKVILDNLPSGSSCHCYADLLDVLQPAVLEKVMEIEATESEPWAAWKNVIMGSKLRTCVPCQHPAHKFEARLVERADIDISGSVCKDMDW